MATRWTMLLLLLILPALGLCGSYLYRRSAHESHQLWICQSAQNLVQTLHQELSTWRKLPDDEILKHLLFKNLFAPRAEKLGNFARLIHPTFSPAQKLLEKQFTQYYRTWEKTIVSASECPEPLLPKEYVLRFWPEGPPIEPPAIDDEIKGLLPQMTAVASQMNAEISEDSALLCQSRKAVAKAEQIRDYLTQNCHQKKYRCGPPLARAQLQVTELSGIEAINAIKFQEKWSPWLSKTEIDCVSKKGQRSQ